MADDSFWRLLEDDPLRGDGTPSFAKIDDKGLDQFGFVAVSAIRSAAKIPGAEKSLEKAHPAIVVQPVKSKSIKTAILDEATPLMDVPIPVNLPVWQKTHGALDTRPPGPDEFYHTFWINSENYLSLMPLVSDTKIKSIIKDLNAALKKKEEVYVGADDEILIKEKLACGSYACAYVCNRIGDKDDCVVKIMIKPTGVYETKNRIVPRVIFEAEDVIYLDGFLREYVFMKQVYDLAPKNTVKVLGASALYTEGSQEIHPMLFLEKMDQSMSTFLKDLADKTGSFEEDLLIGITTLTQAFVSWKTMHKNHMLHLDSHAGNFLLSGVDWNPHVDPWSFKVKLADFGLACRMHVDDERTIEFSCATPSITNDSRYKHPILWDAIQFFHGTLLPGLNILYKTAADADPGVRAKVPAAAWGRLEKQNKEAITQYSRMRSNIRHVNSVMPGAPDWSIARASLKGEEALSAFVKHVVWSFNPSQTHKLMSVLKEHAANKNLFK